MVNTRKTILEQSLLFNVCLVACVYMHTQHHSICGWFPRVLDGAVILASQCIQRRYIQSSVDLRMCPQR